MGSSTKKTLGRVINHRIKILKRVERIMVRRDALAEALILKGARYGIENLKSELTAADLKLKVEIIEKDDQKSTASDQ